MSVIFHNKNTHESLINGSSGIDNIYPTDIKISDTVNAGAGADTIDYSTSLVGNTLFGEDDNDSITGGLGNDTLNGGLGDDYLDGGASNNTLTGGAGADFFSVGSGDVITDLGYGADSLYVMSDATFNGVVTANWKAGDQTMINGIANLTSAGFSVDVSAAGIGVNGFNITSTGKKSVTLVGSALDDHLVSGAGNDLLDAGDGINTLEGGIGNDTYIIHALTDVVIEAAGAGTDTLKSSVSINLTNFANIENLTLIDGDSIDATGDTGNNVITGNTGSNILAGGAGTDTLIGGGGDDFYNVNLTAQGALEDVIIAGADRDTVNVLGLYSGVLKTLTVGTGIEGFDLSGTGDSLLNLKGNSLNNTLAGNDADNYIDGGLGDDIMAGGIGNDTYIVNSLNDSISENQSEGVDQVFSSVSHTLEDSVENLTLTGKSAIYGAGNYDDNILIGNAANNTLDGNDGNDTITGGAGIDTMSGGMGDDFYSVENSKDVVLEGIDGGYDVINSTVSYSLQAGQEIEELILMGAGSLNGTGNELDNTIFGNANSNILNGGLGADTLFGGKGNDTYIIDNANDIAVEAANEGIDLVKSSVSFDLRGSEIENLTLTGIDAINGVGSAVANIIIGNTGNNVLTGNEGVDTLIGGGGNDTYTVNLTSAGRLEDKVIAGSGFDTIQVNGGYAGTAKTLTTAASIEGLDISGTQYSLLNVQGNACNNILIGNGGNNILNGKTGNDTLTGGQGSDTFVFDAKPNALLNVDTITDFWTGEDRLQFTKSAFGKNIGATGHMIMGDDRFCSDATGNAHIAANRFIYNSTSGELFYDADGNGIGAAIMIELLGTDIHPDLQAIDIWII